MTTEKRNAPGQGGTPRIIFNGRQLQFISPLPRSQAVRDEILWQKFNTAHRQYLNNPTVQNLYLAGLLCIAWRTEFDGAAT